MTDNEIIKALECCVYGLSVCKNCHYNYSDDCQRTMMTDVLNLIDRQNSESERLSCQLEKCENDGEYWESKYNNAKSEAIREFAERVKQEINFPLAVWRVFDNLVKEMAGE